MNAQLERALELFLRRVDTSGECWLWQGPKNRHGYGIVGHSFMGRTEEAHRYAYFLMVGLVPEGWHLHHECRQPACVNPLHLAATPAGRHWLFHKSFPSVGINDAVRDAWLVSRLFPNRPCEGATAPVWG